MIPTAEEFLKNKGNTYIESDNDSKTLFADMILPSDLIEFAKLHVEAALKAAAYSPIANSNGIIDIFSNTLKSVILDAYPLSNIK